MEIGGASRSCCRRACTDSTWWWMDAGPCRPVCHPLRQGVQVQIEIADRENGADQEDADSDHDDVAVTRRRDETRQMMRGKWMQGFTHATLHFARAVASNAPTKAWIGAQPGSSIFAQSWKLASAELVASGERFGPRWRCAPDGPERVGDLEDAIGQELGVPAGLMEHVVVPGADQGQVGQLRRKQRLLGNVSPRSFEGFLKAKSPRSAWKVGTSAELRL